MTDPMSCHTVITSIGISPNPVDTGETFIADVQASNKMKWRDYASDTWSDVSALVWG